MNRYLVVVKYYNFNGYGFFRKKIYAVDEKHAKSSFKRLLDNKFTFSNELYVRKINTL